MELDILVHEKREEIAESRELFQAVKLLNDLDENWYVGRDASRSIPGTIISGQAFGGTIANVIRLVKDARKHEARIESLGKTGLEIMEKEMKRGPATEEIRWLSYSEQIKERLRYIITNLESLKGAAESTTWPYAKIFGRDRLDARLGVSEVLIELVQLTNAVHYSFVLGQKLGILPNL